jgi:hypothetical protein
MRLPASNQPLRASPFTGMEKVLASTPLGMADGCAKGIAPSTQRKFPMAAELFLPMRNVWQ